MMVDSPVANVGGSVPDRLDVRLQMMVHSPVANVGGSGSSEFVLFNESSWCTTTQPF